VEQNAGSTGLAKASTRVSRESVLLRFAIVHAERSRPVFPCAPKPRRLSPDDLCRRVPRCHPLIVQKEPKAKMGVVLGPYSNRGHGPARGKG
jgi:hypothetical protein